MKIGVIADDFTGASDIALTLAEAGMRVAQFVGVPRTAPDAQLDGGVIALKSRTAPLSEALTSSMAACEWLLAQGATQIVLKVCSTFDSTPAGNIGPVLDALSDRLDARSVMVCPAFPENGRSVYQGHLFVGDRLLSESGMENHPLTPMTDPDLRRVLAAQSARPIAHIPVATVISGARAITDAMDQRAHFIIDAITEKNLRDIGLAATSQVLLCGGSGIALGLPQNFGFAPKQPNWHRTTGKGAVLSGSCSPATRAQVARYAEGAPFQEICAKDAVAGGVDIERLADWAVAQEMAPLIYTSADPDVVRAAQDEFGADMAATAIEALFARLAVALVARGTRRIVVAGGETSGAVVTGLELETLTIGPRAAAGIPLVSGKGLALALKSGNFGGPDFFSHTLAMMEKDQ